MALEYLLGVDLGTSGTKTVLFDTEGNTVASATIEYPMYQPQNGWAEQDQVYLVPKMPLTICISTMTETAIP